MLVAVYSSELSTTSLPRTAWTGRKSWSLPCLPKHVIIWGEVPTWETWGEGAEDLLNSAPLHSFCGFCSHAEFLNLSEQNVSQKHWLVWWVWGEGRTRWVSHCWCQGPGKHKQERMLFSPFHLPSHRRRAVPSPPPFGLGGAAAEGRSSFHATQLVEP